MNGTRETAGAGVGRRSAGARALDLRAALAVAAFVLAYATALQWVWDRWTMADSDYAHGLLLPFVAAFAVWQDRARLVALPVRADVRGWLLLAPGLAVHAVGAGLTVDSISAASLLLAVPGLVWLLQGAPRTRALAPVFGLLAFTIPLPIFVTGRIAFELKEIAVDAGVALANVFGVAAVRSGVEIEVPVSDGGVAQLFVADACSGLRSLMALATLGYVLAFVLGAERRAVWRRVVLLLLTVPLAVVGNVARIAAICAVAGSQGAEFASGTGHDVLNLVSWAVVLGGILGIDALLGRLAGSSARASADGSPVGSPKQEPVAASGRRCVGVASLAVLAVLGPLLLASSLYRPFAPTRRLAENIPARLGGFELAEEYRLTPRHGQLLGTDDAVWRRYRGPRGHDVFLVAVFHGANWKSVHPPQICLRGTNMELLEDRYEVVAADDGAFDVGYIVAQSRDPEKAGERYVALHVFGGAAWSGASYTSFFLRHAPRAVLRAGTDGFLLRVETWCDQGESPRDAARRCAGMLERLLPEAQGLLR